MGKASKGLLDDDDDEKGLEGTDLTLGINLKYASRLEVNVTARPWPQS
jgi:hypothetical protein